MEKKYLFVLGIMCFLQFSSCNRENKSINELFENEVLLNPVYSYFDKDSLANPYRFVIIDSFLIVHDVYELKHFTLFNTNSGNCIGRFGDIGIGPGEISIGHVLSVKQGKLYSHSISPNHLIQYDLDSLINYRRYCPPTIAKFEQTQKFYVSRFLPIDSSYFIGAGFYDSKYQYALFNLQNEVSDYSREVFNSKESYSDIHKFLSNQGIFKNHPKKDKFVYSVSRSSNIDFLEVTNGKINIMKSIKLSDPQIKPVDLGNNSYTIDYNPHSVLGFLDIFPTDNFVYTLYSDKPEINNDGSYNDYSSDVILVFDWEGNPVKKFILDKEVAYIGIDEIEKKFYTIQKDNEGGWVIAYFKFEM